MLYEDVLDASNLVLRLALGQLNRFYAAVQNRSIRRKFGNFCELLGIS